MELVGARLGLHFDDSRGALAGFSVVVLQSYFGFLNGVEVRIDYDDAKDRILVVGTVEFKAGAGKVLPVDVNLPAALRIFSGSVVKTGQFLSAW